MKGRDDMNIFKHTEYFFGCLGSEATGDSLLSLFQLAKKIKLRLGGKGYLLDNYLSLIFEGLSTETTFGAADSGTDVCGSIQSYFLALLENTEPKQPHPLEKQMREIYARQADSISYQESYTKLCMLLFSMTDEILIQAVDAYIAKLDSSLCGEVEEVRIAELYAEMAHLAGESLLEELNEKIRQRFMIAPLALVFAQGVNDDLLIRLTTRDNETSKQMFQLLLDSMSENAEV